MKICDHNSYIKTIWVAVLEPEFLQKLHKMFYHKETSKKFRHKILVTFDDCNL